MPNSQSVIETLSRKSPRIQKTEQHSKVNFGKFKNIKIIESMFLDPSGINQMLITEKNQKNLQQLSNK